MGVEGFWSLTPHQFDLAVEARRKALSETYKRSLFEAWHAASFTAAAWRGKLPRLSTVLSDEDEVEVTPEQLAAWAKASERPSR